MATRVADLVTAPDRVMLDTNVLIAATDEGRAGHLDALTVVNDWVAGRTELCMSGQILREYLMVATRPAEKNGLGLNLPDALGNVHAIRERTTLLAENAKVADRLCASSPMWNAGASRFTTRTWSRRCLFMASARSSR